MSRGFDEEYEGKELFRYTSNKKSFQLIELD